MTRQTQVRWTAARKIEALSYLELHGTNPYNIPVHELAQWKFLNERYGTSALSPKCSLTQAREAPAADIDILPTFRLVNRYHHQLVSVSKKNGERLRPFPAPSLTPRQQYFCLLLRAFTNKYGIATLCDLAMLFWPKEQQQLPGAKCMYVRIVPINKKLANEPQAAHLHIEYVWGRGYRLAENHASQRAAQVARFETRV